MATNEDGSSDTFELEANAVEETKKNQSSHSPTDSDEFAFESRPMLKPSNVQKQIDSKSTTIKNKNTKNAKTTSQESEITIQSDILAAHLKPTDILSKYQTANSTVNPNNQSNQAEEQEFNIAVQSFATNTESQMETETTLVDNASLIISFDECLKTLYEVSDAFHNEKQNKVDQFDFRDIGWFKWIAYFVCGPPKLPKKLESERDRLLTMTKLKFDDSSNISAELQDRMLQTLWQRITQDAKQCPKYGSHWEMIGFQGNDPRTDIRGCGAFGVVQLMFGVSSTKYSQLMIDKIYKLSRDERQQFPFCIVSFNISSIVLTLLRETLIYSQIKQTNSVIDCVNQIYIALFYKFYIDWKNMSRTIIDYDKASKELSHEARVNWKNLLNILQKQFESKNDAKNFDSKDDNISSQQFGSSQKISNSKNENQSQTNNTTSDRFARYAAND